MPYSRGDQGFFRRALGAVEGLRLGLVWLLGEWEEDERGDRWINQSLSPLTLGSWGEDRVLHRFEVEAFTGRGTRLAVKARALASSCQASHLI